MRGLSSLLFWLLIINAVLVGGEPVTDHYVVPAALRESYHDDDHDTASLVLRCILPGAFEISHNVIHRNTSDNNHDRSNDNVDRFLRAAERRFLASLFPLPDFPQDYNPAAGQRIPLTRLILMVSSDYIQLGPEMDESYQLHIPDNQDDAVLTSPTVFGALRGLETLSQLVEYDGGTWEDHDYYPVFVIRRTPLDIVDAPVYPHRGLLIDTARHYLPLALLLANLDVMAMNKLNVLHWHMTDSESFPFQSRYYPELAIQGAFSPHRVYTPLDIQVVVEEARLRGIRVIPEVDMPGHTQAVGKSHSELLSHCPDPMEPLDPTNPDVYAFLTTLYSELVDLFPDPVIHVGGDEVSLECWKHSGSIQTWMKNHGIETETALYDYFETKLLNIVGQVYQKQAVVWQEVWNLGLSLRNDTIVNVWKGYDRDTIQSATLRNFQVLVSGPWYLDHLQDDWITFYQNDPRNFTGTEAQKALVIGGHASMWGEHVDASNFMSRVWPRASAVAERLWSGRVLDEEMWSVERRMKRFRCHLLKRGIQAGPIGPGSCEYEPPFALSSTTTTATINPVGQEADGIRIG